MISILLQIHIADSFFILENLFLSTTSAITLSIFFSQLTFTFHAIYFPLPHPFPAFYLSIRQNALCSHFQSSFDQCHGDFWRWWYSAWTSVSIQECRQREHYTTSWHVSVDLRRGLYLYWLSPKPQNSFRKTFTSAISKISWSPCESTVETKAFGLMNPFLSTDVSPRGG